MKNKTILWLMSVSLFLMFTVSATLAQSSRFVYQGSLTNAGAPANGTYDFEFALFDAVSGGNQVGATLPRNGISVVNGTFAAALDFGGVFPGADRFLEIRTRQAGQPGFTTLSPRQSITSAPYAIKSQSADNAAVATNSFSLGGVAANLYVQTGDPRMSDARQPLPGNGDYVQNRITQQAGTDFNISGGGTLGGTLNAAAINSATQYNIGGSRVLGLPGNGNLSVGIDAGANITTGVRNALFGRFAGFDNQTGNDNSFFGSSSGLNTTSSSNSFFGSRAGLSNTTGSNNSFFGHASGDLNSTGSNNAFFGYGTGLANAASNNSFFGSQSGFVNTTGFNNAFFGREAGRTNVTGTDNAFFGYRAGAANNASQSSFFGSMAGESNTTGTGNAFFGYQAGRASVVASDNAFFGSLAGSNNSLGARNSFFGRNAGSGNNVDSDNSFFGYNAGTLNQGPSNSFFGSLAGSSNVSGARNSFFGHRAGEDNTGGPNNSFFGWEAGLSNTTAANNVFVGAAAGRANTTASRNTFLGYFAGEANTTGADNTFVGSDAGLANTGARNSFFGSEAGDSNTTGSENSFFGKSAGHSNVTGDNNTYLGHFAGAISTGFNNTFIGHLAGNGNAGGANNTIIGQDADVTSGNLIYATAIGAGATVSTNATIVLGRSGGNDGVRVPGTLNVGSLLGSGNTALCLNASDYLSTCSSSMRYKTDVASFGGGFEIVRRLRPIVFNWKEGGMHDVGFAAEEVAEVEPLLVTRNSAGEIEGVKYEQITTVLVNTAKEQQSRIEQLEREIEGLKQLVCELKPASSLCSKQK